MIIIIIFCHWFNFKIKSFNFSFHMIFYLIILLQQSMQKSHI
nr:MAG TPA: hypothetical protein [Crassvirales sp.]